MNIKKPEPQLKKGEIISLDKDGRTLLEVLKSEIVWNDEEQKFVEQVQFV